MAHAERRPLPTASESTVLLRLGLRVLCCCGMPLRLAGYALSHSHPTCHSILEGRRQLALEEAAGTDAEDCHRLLQTIPDSLSPFSHVGRFDDSDVRRQLTRDPHTFCNGTRTIALPGLSVEAYLVDGLASLQKMLCDGS